MTECTQELGYLQSTNSDKHLPQSPFTGKFFPMTTFCIDSYETCSGSGGGGGTMQFTIARRMWQNKAFPGKREEGGEPMKD